MTIGMARMRELTLFEKIELQKCEKERLEIVKTIILNGVSNMLHSIVSYFLRTKKINMVIKNERKNIYKGKNYNYKNQVNTMMTMKIKDSNLFRITRR